MSIAKPMGFLKKSKLAKCTLVRQTSWPKKQDAFDYFYQRGMFRGWENACLWDYVNHAMRSGVNGKSWQLACPPKLEADIFASYPKNLWRSLNKVQIPCWILFGEKSYPMVQRSAKRLANKHRYYQIQSFPGGHCFMQENPQSVAKSIIKILK
jgi:pimeloyl-ACP methyl ester carboxylesterase